MWRWDQQEPFGNSPPNEDPDGDSNAFEFNLRFPGQYYDRETNLSYNYFREYDPGTGRYIESDPLGLRGGLNTYVYVADRPLMRSDPLGLCAYHGNWCGPDWTGGARRTYGQIGLGDDVLPPIDALDRCYMVHDICYWECRRDYPCTPDSRGNCMSKCDRNLAKCAEKAGSRLGSPLWWWMKYNRSPDIGPNCPSCPVK